ncbi:hypothetical protein BDV95DRAFT_575717 [Massariosphaeria phaeospora]|uniref:Uncharacterized protein n=1 Tax=Massariosphaeria phaeospora TaxID=100035 RepID=A0A7C8I440_9PLEO|nr:hypothetical protein BDV95DRAFT_575717 [Massariosphaeria phaeospora]
MPLRLRLPSTRSLHLRAPLPKPTTLASTHHHHRALTTSPRRALKEDANRTPDQLEQKKQEQLDKQKRGEGHWHEELGSSSEGNVAADRQEVKGGDHEEHIGKLQEETKRKGEEGEI